MIIRFDSTAFHVANTCRDSGIGAPPTLGYVVVFPNGVVQSTDAYRGNRHAKGCAPFELNAAAVAVKPVGKLPVTARGIEVHFDVPAVIKYSHGTHGPAGTQTVHGQLHYLQGKSAKIMLCEILLCETDFFPAVNQVIPKAAQNYTSDLLGLNFRLAYEIVQALSAGKSTHGILQFTGNNGNGLVMFETKDPDHVVILSPLRLNDVVRPLPVNTLAD